MAEYQSQTIKELIDNIKAGRVILPAIQRNFVWPEEKIYHLFDSLMRDYPIGTFLFWELDEETFDSYVFNTIISEYDEQKGKLQRGDTAKARFSDYSAVLDGQQRITSLYIGICGKYRTHIKRRKWDDPSAYEEKFLCIDIMKQPSLEESYKFRFMTNDKIEKKLENEDGNSEYWVKVSKVFDGFGENLDEADYIDSLATENADFFSDDKQRTSARKLLKRLGIVLKDTKNVNYFPAKNMSLPEVVEIFVRVNSGGEKLVSADLMLSVAAGEQGDVDVHVLVQDAINEINDEPDDTENGFKVDKDLILSAGLMLTNAESLSLSKKENYSHTQMNAIFKDNWDAIIEALKNTVRYVEYLGFIGKKLPRSIILPIAYYFYENKLSSSHCTSTSNRACCDRIFIRQWILRAMLNNVFSEGTGATLISIRKALKASRKEYYPLDELMDKAIKKTLKIEEEQIDEILDISYGDEKIIPIFEELTRSTSTTDDIDHIWPKSVLSNKATLKKHYKAITVDQIALYKEKCNALVNLQLLDAAENRTKLAKDYDEWLNEVYSDTSKRDRYCDDHFIPKAVSYKIEDLPDFWEKRETILRTELAKAFPSDFNVLVKQYGLEKKI